MFDLCQECTLANTAVDLESGHHSIQHWNKNADNRADIREDLQQLLCCN